MSAAASALRIRLEGGLEVLEAGIERYRAARSLGRDALERLLAHEDALEAAADRAARLPEAEAIMQRLFRARRALRKKLRARLNRFGVDPFRFTLIEEIDAFLARLLPEVRGPPAARYEVKPQWNAPLHFGAVMLAMSIFVISMPVGIAAFVVLGLWILNERGTLDVHSDRIRFKRRLRAARELPLKFVTARASFSFLDTPIGHFDLGSEYSAEQAHTLIELLRFPAFANIGQIGDEEAVFVESRTRDEEGAALVSGESVLFIPDGHRAYDLAVEGHTAWVDPRAWLLAHLISRLPPEDRQRVVNRLTVSGCARVLTLQQMREEFDQQW